MEGGGVAGTLGFRRRSFDRLTGVWAYLETGVFVFPKCECEV